MTQGTKRWRQETIRRGKQRSTIWWCEVKGPEPGPTLGIVAGQHGMEPTGPGALAVFLDELDPAKVRGTLRVAPMAYAEALRGGFECALTPRAEARAKRQAMRWGACPFGLNRQRCGRNLNREWPGKANGSMHARMAHALWNALLADADYIIDFHCWSDSGPAGIIAYSDEAIEFARTFGIPHIQRYPLDDHPGMLALASLRAGKTAITVEVTPQTRISRDGAEAVIKGMRNTMRHLGMLPGKAPMLRTHYLTEYKPGDRKLMPVPWDATVVPVLPLGTYCRKGDVLGKAIRLDHPRTVRVLRAPCDGMYVGTPQRAVVAKGESPLVFYRVKVLK